MSTLTISKIRTYSRAEDNSSFSVVRVHKRILPLLGGRNRWVKITCGDGSVYRMAKGADSATGFTQETIELDYDTWLELGYDPGTRGDENRYFPCDMAIRKASRIETYIAHWMHPDPAYSVPMRFGVITYFMGVCTGVIGLVIGG